jgi:hypothetical protein
LDDRDERKSEWPVTLQLVGVLDRAVAALRGRVADRPEFKADVAAAEAAVAHLKGLIWTRVVASKRTTKQT